MVGDGGRTEEERAALTVRGGGDEGSLPLWIDGDGLDVVKELKKQGEHELVLHPSHRAPR